MLAMSDEVTRREIKPGQPPLGQRHLEKTVYLKFALLESQYAYLKTAAESQGISAAELLRRLIDERMSRE